MTNVRASSPRALTPAGAKGRAYWAQRAIKANRKRKADREGKPRPIDGLGNWDGRKQRLFGAAALDFNFVARKYSGYTEAQIAANFTRASVAYGDVDGTIWRAFQANAPRITNHGLLMEGASTNSVRNNSMQGAVVGVVGSGGALPTNWSVANNTGISTEVKGIGTENGVDYVDLRFFGTSGASQNLVVSWETSTGIAAVNADTWAHSAFLKMVANIVGPNSAILILSQRDAGGLTLGADLPSAALLPFDSYFRRYGHTATINNASTAFTMPRLGMGLSNGVAYDFTVRIGWPQVEKGTGSQVAITSPIRTTGSAVVRAADQLLFASIPQYLGGAVTLYAEAMSNGNLGAANEGILSLDDGTTVNRFQIRRGGSSSVNFLTATGGVIQANPGIASQFAPRVAVKMAWANASADTRGAANKTLSAAGGGTLPSGISKLQIGNAVGVNFFWGYIRRIAIFNARLSDGQLTDITT